MSKCLSPGQKALYFFWHLDGQVCNGGFIQFYWNGYGKYIAAILDGLNLINDIIMDNLVIASVNTYLKHKDFFNSQKQKDNWEPLYNDLKEFDEFDAQYYLIHDQTMKLIEMFIRTHPEEFVLLK